MLPLTTATLLLLSLGTTQGHVVGRSPQNDVKAQNMKRTSPAATCLAPEVVQTASLYTGLEEGTPGIRPGLSQSAT